MSSGAEGPRPPPVTRCCSAPTQAAPSGSDHSLAPGLHSGLLLMPQDIPGPTLSRVGPGFGHHQQQHPAGLLPHGPVGTEALGFGQCHQARARVGDSLARLG